MVTHVGPLQRTDRNNFEFLKIQDGGAPHLENRVFPKENPPSPPFLPPFPSPGFFKTL